MNDNYNNILKSFELKGTLNPEVWDNYDNIGKSKLKENIRKSLLDITDEFIEFLKVDVFVEDVILTGSLSNYNWSKFSDFDIHVVVDMSQYEKDEVELYKELFDLKKILFNTKHDIKVIGYDVELYVQDKNEPHTSTGVYSIVYDTWESKPEKMTKKLNLPIVKEKAKKFEILIDDLIDTIDEYDLDEAKEIIKKLKEKLKKYRKTGLDTEGELSYENLVFKYLRRSGYIDKLFDLENEYIDKELSLKS